MGRFAAGGRKQPEACIHTAFLQADAGTRTPDPLLYHVVAPSHSVFPANRDVLCDSRIDCGVPSPQRHRNFSAVLIGGQLA